MDTISDVGGLLREWRRRRRRSQMDLALDSGVSTRHLSFVESGRAAPGRELLLRLAEALEIPLRERNVLLLAGGYAPAYPARSLSDPVIAPTLDMVRRLLKAHQPFPALAVDRYWTLVAMNEAVQHLVQGVDPSLLTPPVNVLRLSLHPGGLAPRIANLREWRDHLLSRLRKQVDESGDLQLLKLLAELEAYPSRKAHRGKPPDHALAVPLRLCTERGELAFLSATMSFGTPLDVALSELAIEIFLPADEATSRLLGT